MADITIVNGVYKPTYNWGAPSCIVFPIHQAKINCESPASTNGYLVTERSTVAQLFDVAVSCARGWEGTATVTPCASSGEKYTLTGCSHLVDVDVYIYI